MMGGGRTGESGGKIQIPIWIHLRYLNLVNIF